MKLRNKKTGKIFDWREDLMPFGLGLPHPKSLAELNEEWEDYKPTEPLIKDEKIRKAVRAWADANNYEAVRCNYYDRGCVMFSLGVASIVFMDFHEKIEADITYTIEELCGEEE
jgi:hypothetical protein